MLTRTCTLTAGRLASRSIAVCVMTTGTDETRRIGRILEQLSSDDPQAGWETFLASYSDLIFQVMSILDRDPDNRSDSFLYACQQLHKNKFRRLRQFKPGGPARFSTWLRAVVRNLYLDWRRRRFGSRFWAPTVSLDFQTKPGAVPLGEQLTSHHPDPEIVALLHERHAGLENALGKLEPSELLIVHLRYQEDLTLDQISRIIGLGSPQSVRYHLQGVLEKLKKALS